MYPQAKVPLRKSHATIFIVQVNGATSNGPPLRVSKMELSEILEKIENIVTEAHKILQLLNLPSGSNVNKRQIVAENSRGAVTTVAPPCLVIGREKDRVKVISMLRETLDDGQRDRSGAKPYSTIGIYGLMAFLGLVNLPSHSMFAPMRKTISTLTLSSGSMCRRNLVCKPF